MSFQLEPTQIEKIEGYFDHFREYLKTEEGKEWQRDRRDRKKLYEDLLNQNNVDNLTEGEFSQILQGLWANAGWTNKAYVAEQVLKSNDFSILRSELKNLLWGKQSLA